MLIQSTNTGGDLGSNQFDIAMPGGGLGIFDGCSSQFGGLGGSRYGGVANRSECESMPTALRPGCYWRFDWFNNADNPDHQFTQVWSPIVALVDNGWYGIHSDPEQIKCPTELVNKTGCKRTDDDKFPAYTPTATVWASPTPSVNAKQWEQCDSLLWDAQAICPSGTTCQRVTDCKSLASHCEKPSIDSPQIIGSASEDVSQRKSGMLGICMSGTSGNSLSTEAGIRDGWRKTSISEIMWRHSMCKLGQKD